MNFRELLSTLDNLAEDDASDLAAYQRGKAQQDKLDSVEQVKKLAVEPQGNMGSVTANYIDPKDGIIKYKENGTAKDFSYDWFQKGQEKNFFALLKNAGLEVIPVEKKSLFGSYQVAGVKPETLTALVSGAPAQGQTQQAPAASPDVAEKVKKLKELITQYNNKKGATATAPVATNPAPAKVDQSGKPVVGPGNKDGDAWDTHGAKNPPKPTGGSVTQQPDGTFILKKKDGTTIHIDKEGRVLKEWKESISNQLIESFNEEQTDEGWGTAAKTGLKYGAKVAPFVGSALSAKEAYDRWQEGDRSGAVIAALAGVGWLIPGPLGWVVGGGLDAYNIGKDVAKDFKAQATPAAPTTPAAPAATSQSGKPGGDPKIIALQKYLLSQGAKNKDGTPLTVDGFMGPNTEAAMTAANLNEAQKIELLRLQLEAIDEGAGPVKDVIKAGVKGGIEGLSKLKNKITGFYKGTKSPDVTPWMPGVKGVTPQFKAGQAVGRNTGKIAAGTMAATGTAGYMAGPGGATVASAPPEVPAAPVASVPHSSTHQSGKPDAQPQTGTDLEALKNEIRTLTGDIKGSGAKGQEIDDLIKQAEEILQMTVGATKVDQGGKPVANTGELKGFAQTYDDTGLKSTMSQIGKK